MRIKAWLAQHKRHLWLTAGGVLLLTIAVQLIYPTNQTVPFLTVDNVAIGGTSKEEASQRLDEMYAHQRIGLFLNEQSGPAKTFAPAEIGVVARNQPRVADYDYPLWWRLVPSSIFWYHHLQTAGTPEYVRDEVQANKFMAEQFGKKCVLKPQNATITPKGETLEVVEAKDGGTCSSEEIRTSVQKLTIVPGQTAMLRVQVEIAPPDVSTEAARQLADKLTRGTASGVQLKVKNEAETITKKELYTWLDFTVKKKQLTPVLSEKKAKTYLDKTVAPKVTVPAGKTTITTRDFTVVSQKKGKNGATLDRTVTLANVLSVMQGEKPSATAAVKTLRPSVTYKRSYTKTSTGIAAMLEHYAKDHPGTFGVSFVELGGGKRAEYNSSQSFITASTYKLFVAYGTLKKVEKKDWKWSDQVTGGRDLATCFEDMIAKSDNPCAETLYKKIGYQKVINDVRKLGLGGTVLAADGQRTTAADLALFLNKLKTGSIDLKAASRDRLLGAMGRNTYRQGIPAGTNGKVAAKVGFLNGLLHDAAIVSSPKGDYVLVVMSGGSSWGAIAEITRKIEALR